MSQRAAKVFTNAKVVNSNTGSSTSAAMSQSAAKAYTNAAVADKAKVTISSSAPSFPNVGDIWVLPT